MSLSDDKDALEVAAAADNFNNALIEGDAETVLDKLRKKTV